MSDQPVPEVPAEEHPDVPEVAPQVLEASPEKLDTQPGEASPTVPPDEAVEEPQVVAVTEAEIVSSAGEVVEVRPVKKVARFSPEGVLLSKCVFSREGVILEVLEE